MSDVAPTAGALIATLPAGYRPRNAQLFAVAMNAPPEAGRVDVYADGRVVWFAGPGGAANYTSLSGISFWTD
ncbi:MAG: hypothetical protein H0W96_03845 [Solirubrobacterales bacterium]|nr:hypothetical protein [Solirubrobacterales bacterium]